MNFTADIIALKLLSNKPVMILGPKGSGKYQLARKVFDKIDNNPGRLPFVQLDFQDHYHDFYIKNESEWLGKDFHFMNKIDTKLNSNQDKILYCINFEKAGPQWVCFILEQCMFKKRKTLIVGEYCNSNPLLERFEIVSL